MQYSTRGNPWIGFMFLILFLLLGFYFIKGLFFLLRWVAPVLFILTLLINYRVVLDYGKWLYNLLLERPLSGLLYILLTFVGFPFVVGFLFFKALGVRYMKKVGQQIKEEREGIWTDYEVVDTNEVSDSDSNIEEDGPFLSGYEER